MARDAATYVPPTVPAKIKLTPWGAGTTMYRVHETVYAVDEFNPSSKGNARFSPILDPSGNVIPTLYAATTPRGALMESVFRDVPYRTGFKHVDRKRLEGRACSTLLFQTNFQLLDSEQGRTSRTGHSASPSDRHDEGSLPGDERLGRADLRRPCQGAGISLVFPAGRSFSRRGVVWEPGTSIGPPRWQVLPPAYQERSP